MKLLSLPPCILQLLLLSTTTNAETPAQIPLSEECIHPPSKIHIFSHSPLVIYIEDFITPSERSHLLSITKGTFSSSSVSDNTGTQGLRQTRTSQSTSVARDAIVTCIESRALSFQSPSLPHSHLEPFQLVLYHPTQKFHQHTDWFPPSPLTSPLYGGNRLSSFFAYISTTNLTGGGTNFPLLDAPRGEEWCEFIDCDEEFENGVTFRPVEGNAVFWRNLDEKGEGDERTVHAGLPVVGGMKMGINIWTREGPVDEKFRGSR